MTWRTTTVAAMAVICIARECEAGRSASLGTEQPRHEVIELEAGQVVSSSLSLVPGEVPALLRFKRESDSSNAKVTVFADGNEIAPNDGFDRDGELVLTSERAGAISLRSDNGNARLRLVGVTRLNVASELQRNGELDLDYIEDLEGDDGRRRIARAVVRVVHFMPAGAVEGCTGFQFGRGYFLTNAHCVGEGKLRLVFGSVRGKFSGVASREARIVAKGTPNSPPGCGQLDFAVLEASPPSDYADAILSLATSDADLDSKPELQLIQQWQDDTSPRGKAISQDDDCRVLEWPRKIGNLDRAALIHRCDTESGSSGAPLLLRDGSRVVGIHFVGLGTDKGGCALSSVALRGILAAGAATKAIPFQD